jgi:hypothetical protein
MIERFCSGGRPRPRFSGSMGNKPFRTRHSASVRLPCSSLPAKSSLESILSRLVNRSQHKALPDLPILQLCLPGRLYGFGGSV